MLFRTWMITFVLFQANCGDPVPEFDGFNKSQVEYLLSGPTGKIWRLTERLADGQAVSPNDCEAGGLLIFVPDSRNSANPLLYAYDPSGCDSLSFCNAFPGYCLNDVDICNKESSFCNGLGETTLFIGYWEVKKPVLSNARTDTVFLHLWEGIRTMRIDRITASSVHFEYDNIPEIVEELYFWEEPD